MTNFYSAQFIVFLTIVLICYYTIFKKRQWICLLAASTVFYYWTGIGNFIYVLITGLSTWAGAKVLRKLSEKLQLLKKDKSLEKAEKESKKADILKKRRIIMWSVMLLNFGMLACFKYIPVLWDNVLGFVLPLGISFYMFQSVGYLLDIYNDKYLPEDNFTQYMLYVTYFPQMIQGPINRYDRLGIQFKEQHTWNGERAEKAFYRVAYGLLKKYAIANIYAGMIASIFDNPARDYSGCMVVFGILLYSAQQYADFSGGIDMVLGVSELFGIQMAENFKQPYFAVSLSDFWRRWHISLGKWMRDYVFYPFALTKPMKKFGKWTNQKLGKHVGRVLPAAIGNLLVFFLVGIWHGADLHYIVWGLYNGVIIAVSDIISPVYKKMTDMLHINVKAAWYRVFQVLRTFIVVNIGWYFDRISNVKIALYSLKKTFFGFDLSAFETECSIIFDGYPEYILGLSVITCIIVFIISFLSEKGYDVRDLLYRAPLGVRWGVCYAVLGMILLAHTISKGAGGFMYANF